MKRYYFNNWLAKVLLYFSTCHTIAVAWLVLSKLDEMQTSQKACNHEAIHSLQWTEITILTGIVLCLVDMIAGIPAWAYLTSGVAYYAWYLLEWLCKLPFGNAYRSISFEQEAYDNDDDNNYVENRHLVTGWLQKVFTVIK